MTTLNLQVSTGNDDSRQQSGADNAGRSYTGSGVVSLTETILSPGSHASGDEWTVAARFLNVTVANAATITSATFQMRANATYSAGSNVVKFWVSAQASDNAGALTSSSGNLNTTARPRTTAVSAAWTQTSVTGGTWYSIDITTVIQEIVNRAGWASGNAIVILVDTHADTTTGEWQDYDSYNGSAAGAPKLDIVYTTGGGGTTHDGGANIGARGWVQALGQRVALGAAGLAAAGWLSAAAQRITEGSLSVSGVGGIGLFGERIALGAAEFSGHGYLDAAGQRVMEGSSGLSGAGYLSVETLKILIGAAGLEAIGRLLADADATGSGTTHDGGAGLGGNGYLLTGPELIKQAEAALQAAGMLGAFGERIALAAAELSAAGWLGGDAQRIALGAIDLGAAGWISASVTLTHNIGMGFAGAGGLSASVLVQALTTGAGNRGAYSPNDRGAFSNSARSSRQTGEREPYQPEPRAVRRHGARTSY